MKLIIGLGNPGIKYEKTRHNLGWRVIEELAQQMKITGWKIDLQFNAEIVQGAFRQEKIILAKPQTFMNESGRAVQSIANYYKIPFSEILVIHDDIDLPLGQIKIQQSRGSAGHKGVQSIIDQLKTNDFIRMRVGIKPADNQQPITNTEKFVLQKFTAEEEKIVQETIKKASTLVVEAL